MRPFTLLLPFLFVTGLAAQSISGNMNTGSAMKALGYGNVDIFRGEELVASVLTDRWGNFNVKLDTGTYRCVMSYDGYATSSRTVRVLADEKVDLSMKAEAAGLERRPATKESKVTTAMEVHSSGMLTAAPLAPAMPWSTGTSGLPPATLGSLVRRPSVSPGMLTAGEVNDFAKWTQWGDLTEKVLGDLRALWSIAPQGRYTLGLQTPSGLPIADAEVHLNGPDGTALFRARTDNTGKAELWAALEPTAGPAPEGLWMEVRHGGRTYRLDGVHPFEQGMNRMVLETSCWASDIVDVAFVVDATGSMQDELDFLRAEMNDIIYRSKRIGDRLNFRFANLFYRDVGPAEAYTTRSMDFTRVLSTAVNFISEQVADGGGDTPEAVETALDSAIHGLSWSAEARARVLFLVLDAGPHLTWAVKQRLLEQVRQAAAKGIRVVPIAASGTDKATEYLMRTLALGTNGTYTFLTDHSGIGASHIEPTTDRFDVGTLNDLLVRILKSFTYMPDCDQALPELELGLPDSLVSVPVDTASMTIAPPDTRASIRWSYYPNPTNGLLHITADTAIPELYITDLSGKVLQIIKGLAADQVVEVDLSPYATGIYLVRYPVGANWVSGKVVLQRH